MSPSIAYPPIMSDSRAPQVIDQVGGKATPFAALRLGDTELAIEQGQLVEQWLLLSQGELEVRRDGRLVDILPAPALLELPAAIRQGPSQASYRASGPVELTVFADAGSPSPADVIESLCREIDRLHQQRDRWARSQDDAYDPSVGGLLVPGPYRFGPFEARFVLMQDDPHRLRRLLPPGLHLLPGCGGRYVLVLADFQNVSSLHPRSDGRRHGYRETTPFIPCVTSRGRIGMFVPELYPDAYMPILLGREIYGFPKRLGRTFAGLGRWDVVLDEQRALKVRWGKEVGIDGADFAEQLLRGLVPALGAPARGTGRLGGILRWLGDHGVPRRFRQSRIFVRKRLLDHAHTHPRRYAVDELVEIPFELMPIRRTRVIRDASVSCQARAVIGGQALQMFAAVGGFEFGPAQTLRRYRNGEGQR